MALSCEELLRLATGAINRAFPLLQDPVLLTARHLPPALTIYEQLSCYTIASFMLAGVDDSVKMLFRSEGAVQVLSLGVCCNFIAIENLGRLAALNCCSIDGLLDKKAKCVLQKHREGRWEGLSQVQVDALIAGHVDQFPGLMRSPFAVELDALVACLIHVASLIDPAPAAGAGSTGVVASVAALRAAYAAVKPNLNGPEAAMLAAGQRPLCSCCLLQCLLQQRWACPGGGG